MCKALLSLILTFSLSSNVFSASPVYTASVQGDFDVVYKNIHDALEKNRLFVVYQIDIGAKTSRFAKRWGENYNRNKLDRIKSMIFCNGWYANEFSNKDIQMMALCPSHLTLTHHDGTTSVNFIRPDIIAKNSKAETAAHDLTELVIKAISEGIDASRK